MPGEPASAVLDYGGAGGSGVRPPGAVGTHRDRADERYGRICRGAAVNAADSEAIVMRGYRALWRDILMPAIEEIASAAATSRGVRRVVSLEA